MPEKLIGTMDDAEFEHMMETFVDHSARLDDEIPADLVFQMLDKAEQTKQPLTVESSIVGNRLILSAAPDALLPPDVREIEVDLPGIHVRVSLESTGSG